MRRGCGRGVREIQKTETSSSGLKILEHIEFPARKLNQMDNMGVMFRVNSRDS
jgi:hypothetical protein